MVIANNDLEEDREEFSVPVQEPTSGSFPDIRLPVADLVQNLILKGQVFHLLDRENIAFCTHQV
jgi:hypothetical protein